MAINVRPTREKLVPVALFCAIFLIYIGSRNTQIWDSQYSMLLSHTLWTRGTFELTPYFEETAEIPYQIGDENGSKFYVYPPGTPVLAVPYVAVANAMGISAIDEAGRPDRSNERLLQRLLAAFVTAGSVVLFHLTARMFFSSLPSLTIAAAAALGTQMWSTVSRAMWAHTFSVFFLAIIIYLLLRREHRNIRPNFLMLGTVLSWLFFVRPTNAVFIMAITAYVVWRERWAAVPLLATGAAWLAGFFAWSMTVLGAPLPSYYRTGSHLDFDRFWSGLAGVLVSPSRGLLVFTPLVFVTLYLCVRFWTSVEYRGLWTLGLLTCCAYLGMISLWPVWWGGHCFGPRLTSEIVPWLVLLTILGAHARRQHLQHRPAGLNCGWWLQTTLAGILVAASVVIHGIGANSSATAEWNQVLAVDENPEVLWDWSRVQFLANLDKAIR